MDFRKITENFAVSMSLSKCSRIINVNILNFIAYVELPEMLASFHPIFFISVQSVSKQ